MADVKTQDREAADVVDEAAAPPEAQALVASVQDQAALSSPVASMTDRDVASAWRTARALAASQLFKDARQAEQAFAKILIGKDLGLSPTESMLNIDIIEGKPAMNANFHALRVKQKPGYDYKVRELSGDRAVIDFYGPGGEKQEEFGRDDHLGRSEFTIDDAQQAKLSERGRAKNGETRVEGTGMYDKYPRNMLFARAMSNGVAWFCPEVLGSIRVYVPGEIESGGAIDSTAEELRAPASAPAVRDEYEWARLPVPEDVRERVRAAVDRANEVAPGSWPPVKCEMTFTGRSATQIVKIAEAVERENARKVSDAVPAGEGPGEEPADAEVVESTLEHGADETVRAVSEHVEALRARARDLAERLPLAQSDREQETLEEELQKVNGELSKLVGETPGQSSLDVQ